MEIGYLSAEVSCEEIRHAVFDLGAFKAPGPDGIQAFFYHEMLPVIGDSVCEMVGGILHDPLLIADINETNIALIPKADQPETLREFRPISLYNVSYKIITKIISRRLRSIMGKMVGDHQCSFILGRQSSDNIIVAQEVIHSMKRKAGAEGWLAVKVDLEKAYDRLEWSFIRETLELIGLNQNLCDLIMACISTPSLRVLWNGEASDAFKPSRGLRQGDPMSPYIFTLCMERLNHIIQDAVLDGYWSPIRLRRGGPLISHLFFADDLILFGEASSFQVDVMIRCLDLFCAHSGQRMNKEKTKICFSKNVHMSRRMELSDWMGVGLTSDMGKYLGIPLIHRRVSQGLFVPIIEKTRRRLSGWKKGCLNLAGRCTLVKSVLAALPSYYMQTMLLPKGVTKELERHSRSFLWGGSEESRKLHLLSWDQVTQDRQNGGLGLKNLRKQNKAFIIKLCWNLLNRKEALWVKVLRSKYLCGANTTPIVQKKTFSSFTWQSIVKVWSKFLWG